MLSHGTCVPGATLHRFWPAVCLVLGGCDPPHALAADLPLRLGEHLHEAVIVGSELPPDIAQPAESSFEEPQPGWRATPPVPGASGLRPDLVEKYTAFLNERQKTHQALR